MSAGRSWSRVVVGACSTVPVALFVTRVALEATRKPWPGALIVAAGLLAALAGFASGLLLYRQRLVHWSAWLPLAYVLWPRRDPVVAASVAVVALLSWALSRRPDALPRWTALAVDGATFVVALAVYAATAALDVLPADAGEFQLVAARLGVAHPPGFPLYTMVGHVFVRLLPFGTPAYRLNLLSGVLAAATLVLTARATRVWARRIGARPRQALAAGLAAALALGGATTFWAQARIANIRTPSTLCVALVLCALARFAAATEPKEVSRALLLLGIALGLGLGHHPSLAFPAVLYVGYVLASEPRLALHPARWWQLAVAVPVGVVPYLYLPIRGAMGAPLAPPQLDTLTGFLNHVLARGFAGDMFAYANATDLPHRLTLVPALFRFQFNGGVLLAGLVAMALLIRRDWRLFVLLAGSLVVHTFVTITYRAPQTVEYLMPAAYPAVAVALGLCPVLLVDLVRRAPMAARSSAFALAGSLVLLAGLLNGWTHGPSFAELASDRTARDTAGLLLDQAPGETLVLSDWHWATPMWYLQQVEGVRPDVEVRYVFSVPGQEYRHTWRERVENVPPTRPLLLTHYYEFSGYTTEPWGAGFLMRARPVSEPVAPITPLDVTFGESIQVIGYSMRPAQPRLGQPTELTLAWRALGELAPAPSLSVRLSGAGSDRFAQADRLLSGDVEPGDVRFERVVLPIYPFLAPGQYQVVLGAYVVSDAGFEDLKASDGATTVSLTGLELAPPAQPPYTGHRLDVPFGDGPTLIGVDYDRSVPGELRVTLRWKGPAGGALNVAVEAPDGQSATVPLPDFPAGTYQTTVIDLAEPVSDGLRLALDSGSSYAAGPWGWTLRWLPLPAPAADARFVPLGENIAVVGAEARPALPGEQMIIDASVVGLRPLTDDYAISIRLMDADGSWLARHDWQPALGAIPTLKWIRGSRVVDRHLLPVPNDFTGDTVQAELVVYERFRETPLPPMDGRFGYVPLGVWPQPPTGEDQ